MKKWITILILMILILGAGYAFDQTPATASSTPTPTPTPTPTTSPTPWNIISFSDPSVFDADWTDPENAEIIVGTFIKQQLDRRYASVGVGLQFNCGTPWFEFCGYMSTLTGNAYLWQTESGEKYLSLSGTRNQYSSQRKEWISADDLRDEELKAELDQEGMHYAVVNVRRLVDLLADHYPMPTLTPSPRPTPAPTPSPTPTSSPTPEPTPTEKPADKENENARQEDREPKIMTALAVQEANPALITAEAIYNESGILDGYVRDAKEKVNMPLGEEYTRLPIGVLTFRSNAFRQNAACGTIQDASALEVVWTVDTGNADESASEGLGWPGQPAITKWSKEVRALSDLYDEKKDKTGMREVIAASMDGTIYFLDLEDGTPTRDKIHPGYPMQGSPSLHPGGIPYMDVGESARNTGEETDQSGLRQYNLYLNREMSLISGSFVTSSLIDRISDTLITADANGLLYVVHMGSSFDYQTGSYSQSPDMVMFTSKAEGETDEDTAVRASVAMYHRYIFYADMGGILRCVDTDTMKTIWAVRTGDSVESTIALDFDPSGGLDLYTANILNKREEGDAQIRCYDAMSGEEKWMAAFGVRKDTETGTVSGFRASPVVGQNQLSEFVYYTVNNLNGEGMDTLGVKESAALIALSKQTGQVIWSKGLNGVAYSSPVAVYDEEGRGWIIQCSGDGSILLLEGMNGNTVSELMVDGSIIGSPAVYRNMMVIGTCGEGKSKIYGIRIQ